MAILDILALAEYTPLFGEPIDSGEEEPVTDGAVLTVPAPILTATAHDRDNAFLSLKILSPVLTAATGARGQLTLPSPVLTAAATSPGYATAALELPAPTLTATAATGSVADVAMVLPTPVLATASGAYASLEWVAPELVAAGTVQHLAQVALTLPFLELTATGKTGAVATVVLALPDPELTVTGAVGGVSHIVLTLPALILTAYGSGVSTESTYSVNLNSGAVTQLLMGAFDKLVTAHGRLYGLREGGLVYLGGDLDEGATAIPATVRFAPQTFGTNRAKRISTVYLSTREDDGLTLEVIPDENTAWRYQTDTDNAPAYGTHKIKTGRGLKFHTAGLILYNRDGGRMDVGGMELLVEPLSRRPKS